MHHDERIEAFYTTRAWRRCRESFLKSKGGLCENCLKKGLIEPATQVHHRQPITPDSLNNPAITLNHANLEALCEDCHRKEHRKTKRWTVDEDGNVMAADPP